MKSHVRIGRLFGIDIRIHATFLLIVAWAAWIGWREEGWQQGLWSAVFVVCVFACIVLHEIGHSLAARRYGIAARTITLYPIGGVAGLTRLPRRPSHEMTIALAGPAVSLALGGLLLGCSGGRVNWDHVMRGPSSLMGLIETLAVSNFVLAGFNLIPAFPMDGGRVLRALLSLVLGYERATVVAAVAGQIFAGLFVVLGALARQPFTIALGVFLALLARGEAALVRRHARLGDRLVADLMDVPAPWIAADAPLASLEEWPVPGGVELPVMFNGRLVGLLDPATVARARREGAEDLPVYDRMRRRFVAVPPDGQLREIIAWLPRTGQRAYPVVENGACVGLLRLSDVLEAAGGRRGPPKPGRWRLDVG